MSDSQKKRVGIFARALSQGGVTRFLHSIFAELNNDTNVEYIVFTDDASLGDAYPNITFIEITARHKLLWDYWASLWVARKHRLDTAVYTKNIIPLTHLLLRAKRVTFVYDLGYFEKSIQAYPFFDSLYMKTLFGISSRIANTILVISEHTKKDMVRILHTKPEKIKVMLLAADESYGPTTDPARIDAVVKKYGLSQPFLLYSGNLSKRKNIRRIIEATSQLKDAIPHHLYIAGPKILGSEEILDQGTKMLGDRFQHIGFVDEEDLPVLYAAADAYLFPSLYEGFGLPILEANACHCPVITSNLTSCPEVAGDAAHIVDAYSTDDIKKGIQRVVTDRKYHDELVQKGAKNAERFSWKKTAQVIRENV